MEISECSAVMSGRNQCGLKRVQDLFTEKYIRKKIWCREFHEKRGDRHNINFAEIEDGDDRR
jgi:hypothetical protein